MQKNQFPDGSLLSTPSAASALFLQNRMPKFIWSWRLSPLRWAFIAKFQTWNGWPLFLPSPLSSAQKP